MSMNSARARKPLIAVIVACALLAAALWTGYPAPSIEHDGTDRLGAYK
jgi:hypothetical protein